MASWDPQSNGTQFNSDRNIEGCGFDQAGAHDDSRSELSQTEQKLGEAVNSAFSDDVTLAATPLPGDESIRQCTTTHSSLALVAHAQMRDALNGLVDVRKVSTLTNNQLTEQLRALIANDQNLGAELLLYLSEVDRRRLYRQQACSSMFGFCVTRLGFSEDVAYKRVTAARLLRQFPVIYEFLSTGKVHLSALTTLGARLTQENHQEWLLLACGKSKRQIEQLIASRCPRPDVAARIRKLPERATSRSDYGQKTADSHDAPRSDPFLRDALSSDAASRAAVSHAQVIDGTWLGVAPVDSISISTAKVNDNLAQPNSRKCSSAVCSGLTAAAPIATSSRDRDVAAVSSVTARTTRVEPLSDHSYRVEFTANAALKHKLDRVSELLSHVVSPTNLPGLIERALDALIEREERRRLGTTVKSESSPDSRSREKHPKRQSETLRARRQQSRYIPANVRRQVWDRDGGQCTFVDDDGNRCEARHFIQFDHREPHAFGGPSTVENLRLRCAAHNAFAAEEVFGRRGSACAK